jgi:hypothetical protein
LPRAQAGQEFDRAVGELDRIMMLIFVVEIDLPKASGVFLNLAAAKNGRYPSEEHVVLNISLEHEFRTR